MKAQATMPTRVAPRNYLADFSNRESSGADDDWTRSLIRATEGSKGSICCRIPPTNKNSWEEDLFGSRWWYLTWQAERPRAPKAEDYRKLEKASENLLKALLPFTPQRSEEASYTVEPLADWWGPYGRRNVGKYYSALVGLKKIAGRKHRGGRPTLDGDVYRTVRFLLRSYEEAFAKPPSPKPDGPTFRFVEAFFRSLEGEWEFAPGPSAKPGDVPARFSVEPLQPKALRTAITKACKASRKGEPLGRAANGFYNHQFRRPA